MDDGMPTVRMNRRQRRKMMFAKITSEHNKVLPGPNVEDSQKALEIIMKDKAEEKKPEAKEKKIIPKAEMYKIRVKPKLHFVMWVLMFMIRLAWLTDMIDLIIDLLFNVREFIQSVRDWLIYLVVWYTNLHQNPSFDVTIMSTGLHTPIKLNFLDKTGYILTYECQVYTNCFDDFRRNVPAAKVSTYTYTTCMRVLSKYDNLNQLIVANTILAYLNEVEFHGVMRDLIPPTVNSIPIT
jgi:hypothetical protein